MPDLPPDNSIIIYQNVLYENIVFGFKIDKLLLDDYINNTLEKHDGILKRIFNIIFINEMKDEYGKRLLKTLSELCNISKKINLNNLLLIDT